MSNSFGVGSTSGFFPNGWKHVKLDTLSKVNDGAHHTPQYTTSGVPFLRVTDIKNKEIDFSSIKYISEEEHQELIKRCKPERGDILYSKNGTIGIPKIINWDWEFSVFVSLALIKMYDDSVDVIYLSKVLESPYIKQQIVKRAKTGTVTNLHLEEIRKFDIPLPPLPEQKKIASILTSVDDVIEKTEAQISKLQDLKKGMMTELLTKGMGHTEFKDSPVGKIPVSWAIQNLGKISEYINGHGFKADDWTDKGYPIIRIQNLNDGKDFNYYDGIVDEKWLIPQGTLLFAWSGQRGKSFGARIWGGETGVLNQHIFKVIPHDQYVTKRFLYRKLIQVQIELELKAHGFKDSFMHVKKGDIVGYNVALPSIEEQLKIDRILTSIDVKYDIALKKLSIHKTLKKALMNDLLTGKKRVTIDN